MNGDRLGQRALEWQQRLANQEYAPAPPGPRRVPCLTVEVVLWWRVHPQVDARIRARPLQRRREEAVLSTRSRRPVAPDRCEGLRSVDFHQRNWNGARFAGTSSRGWARAAAAMPTGREPCRSWSHAKACQRSRTIARWAETRSSDRTWIARLRCARHQRRIADMPEDVARRPARLPVMPGRVEHPPGSDREEARIDVAVSAREPARRLLRAVENTNDEVRTGTRCARDGCASCPRSRRGV